MAHRISGILRDCRPSICLYGSSVLNDFRLGWSDIDILVLTEEQISGEQAQRLVGLRQEMLEEEAGNSYDGKQESLPIVTCGAMDASFKSYYRSFEGGMLTLDAFLSGKKDRVVYWGSSGERITDTYRFDSFGMAELVENSALLYGRDIRAQLRAPSFHELYADVERH